MHLALKFRRCTTVRRNSILALNCMGAFFFPALPATIASAAIVSSRRPFLGKRFPRLNARKCQDKEILSRSPSTQWWSVVASSQYWAPDLFRPRFYVFFVGLAAASAATTPPLPWGLDPTGRHNGGATAHPFLLLPGMAL